MVSEDTFLLALTNLTVAFMQQTPYDPSSEWSSEAEYFDDITYRAASLMSKICKRI